MKMKRSVRWVVFLLVLGLPLAAASWRLWDARFGVTEVHASIPEDGGWLPGTISIPAGEILHLELTSDDVVHGFAIGQSAQPEIELYPGDLRTKERF